MDAFKTPKPGESLAIKLCPECWNRGGAADQMWQNEC